MSHGCPTASNPKRTFAQTLRRAAQYPLCEFTRSAANGGNSADALWTLRRKSNGERAELQHGDSVTTIVVT